MNEYIVSPRQAAILSHPWGDTPKKRQRKKNLKLYRDSHGHGTPRKFFCKNPGSRGALTRLELPKWMQNPFWNTSVEGQLGQG